MIKFENTDVEGIGHAIAAMRNPLNSWDKSDSVWDCSVTTDCSDCPYERDEWGEGYNCLWTSSAAMLGEKDLDLCKRLIAAGPEHRKFLRQIQVWVDITAPLMWWKQTDQYKIGTTTNSCSTMHKLTAKPFELADFSMDGISSDGEFQLIQTIAFLNDTRVDYLEEEDPDVKKMLWRDMVVALPESYNQMRTWSANYETIMTMCRQRKGHKLSEWKQFIEWAELLPYMSEFLEWSN